MDHGGAWSQSVRRQWGGATQKRLPLFPEPRCALRARVRRCSSARPPAGGPKPLERRQHTRPTVACAACSPSLAHPLQAEEELHLQQALRTYADRNGPHLVKQHARELWQSTHPGAAAGTARIAAARAAQQQAAARQAAKKQPAGEQQQQPAGQAAKPAKQPRKPTS